VLWDTPNSHSFTSSNTRFEKGKNFMAQSAFCQKSWGAILLRHNAAARAAPAWWK
jgi:hypothetical protein